jgi:ATP-dependent DNA helicase RecG
MKENQNTEWKEAWRDEYLKWLCGFANAEGGVLVIGRNDRGQAVGVSDAKKLLVDLPNKIRDVLGVMADVRLVHDAGKELVEIRVEPYPSPISYHGEFHYRTGSTRQELKGAALERFLLRKRGLHWVSVPEPSFTPRQCSARALTLFKQGARKSQRVNPQVLNDRREVILSNLDLVAPEGLRRAACLLFSDNPSRCVSGAWIKIGFFRTEDDLRFQDEIHGSLFAQMEQTLELLHTKYLKAYISYEGVQRVERFLFPYGAIREALLNAIVHKDYASLIPIQIKVFDDRLVFWNPGQLPEHWTLRKFLGTHPSQPYNPLLASTFYRAGYIEAWGRGIAKIQRECQEHDIEPPEYDFETAGVMVTFRANPEHLAGEQTPIAKKTTGKTTGKTYGVKLRGKTTGKRLGKTALAIVERMRLTPKMTIAELAEQLGRSLSSIEKQVRQLKEERVITRVGPDKGGHWEVLE